MSIDPATATLPTVPTVTVTAPAPIKAFSQGDGPSFKDVVDIINPLQHIPIINTIYRHLTGDEEGAVADVGGAALYAGPLGIIGSVIDLAVHSETGKSIGDNILSWLGLSDDDAPAEAAEAQTQQARQQMQQQTAANAALPVVTAQTLVPPPVRAAPKEADRREGKDGPSKAGEYLVFGAGNAQPVSLLPTQPEERPIEAAAPPSAPPGRAGEYLVFGGESQSRPQTPAPQPPVQTAEADAAPVGHQGNYMVFGVQPPAAQPSPAAAASAYAAAPMPQASVSVTPQTPIAPPAAQPAAQPKPATPAGLTPLPARNFTMPERRTQVTPSALPPPTTGPSAIPGHAPSQARAAMNQADQSWFAQAMSAGLDKYAAAQKLADQSVTANAGAAASAQASAQSFATIH